MADQKARRAVVSVKYNGANIDTMLEEYLNSITYTDPAEGEGDDLTLNINDRDHKWIGPWFPEKGDTLSATIKLKFWQGKNDKQKFQCGDFVLDDFSFSGEPVKLSIKAVSIPADSCFKKTKHTQTYEEMTVSSIAGEIAGRAGVSLNYDADDIDVERIEQSEQDDCSFLQTLAKRYGLVYKLYRNRIVLFDEARYEAREPVFTITPKVIEPSWSWDTTFDQNYTGAVYEYTHGDQNVTFHVTAGGGDRILKINEAAGSLGEAERITVGQLNEANKAETTMDVTLTLANPSITATSTVQVKGYGRLDGKYYVTKVSWSIGSGVRQKLSLRKVPERIGVESAWIEEPEQWTGGQ